MKNKIFRYKEGSQYWCCHLIEKGSYLSFLKAFERCANFLGYINGLGYINKTLL